MGEEKSSHCQKVLAALAGNSSVGDKERAEVESRLSPLSGSSLRSQGSRDSLSSMRGSKDSLSSIRSSKKRAAPPPPSSGRQPANRTNSECSQEVSRDSHESSLDVHLPRELSPGPSLTSPSLRDLTTHSPSPRSSPRPSACSMDTATTAETIPEDSSPRTATTQEDPQQPLNVVTVTYKQEQASCHGQALELVELIRN